MTQKTWAVDDLVIHIILCDLQYSRILHHISHKKPGEACEPLSLNQAVLWILKISEPRLCEKLSRLYARRIQDITKIKQCSAERQLTRHARTIYNEMLKQSLLLSNLAQQRRYALKSRNPPYGIHNIAVHLIRNDLVHARLASRLAPGARIPGFKLDKAIFWFMYVWDEKKQQEIRTFYNELKSADEIQSQFRSNADLLPVATAIFKLLLERSPLKKFSPEP